MSLLKDVYAEERRRVFAPSPLFTERLIAQLNVRRMQESRFWDLLAGSSRPAFVVAVIPIVSFVVAQLWIPPVPQHGLFESVLESEIGPAERLLYDGTE